MTKLSKPSLSRTNLSVVTGAQFEPEAEVEQVILLGTDLSERAAQNMVIEEAVFNRVLFLNTKLGKSRLSDTIFTGCDMSAAHLSESSFIRVELSGGRMTGTDLSRATLQDVVFTDCKLDMANFRFAKLTRVRFVGCSLVETDFQAAELKQVVFENCHLEKVSFDQSKIKHVDARSSQLYAISGWQSLKGLIIDSAQLVTIAPQIAVELGLIIADD